MLDKEPHGTAIIIKYTMCKSLTKKPRRSFLLCITHDLKFKSGLIFANIAPYPPGILESP